MGQNKALLDFNTQSLLGFVVNKYRTIFKEIYLCCKQDQQSQYVNLGVEFILESKQIYSPMVGLEASLEKLQREIFVVCVDYPFLQKKHFERLQQHWDDSGEILYAQSPSKAHYLIGIYAPSTLPSLKSRLTNQQFKISDWVQGCRSQELYFEDDESFINLNTPEEYQKALLRIEYGK